MSFHGWSSSSGYDRWHRWPVFFLDSSRHSRFPAKHAPAHTHTYACTHAPAHTEMPLCLDSFSNAIDLIDSIGLLFHDQRFPLVCVQYILHTVYSSEPSFSESTSTTRDTTKRLRIGWLFRVDGNLRYSRSRSIHNWVPVTRDSLDT